MERLYIEKTRGTPQIDFDPSTNTLRVEGQSYPENAFKFYEPILLWIRDFLAAANSEIFIEIDFHMPYINSSSTKCIMMMLDEFEDYYSKGNPISIKWYYDDENESSYECAEEFKEDLTLPFNIVKVD